MDRLASFSQLLTLQFLEGCGLTRLCCIGGAGDEFCSLGSQISSPTKFFSDRLLMTLATVILWFWCGHVFKHKLVGHLGLIYHLIFLLLGILGNLNLLT